MNQQQKLTQLKEQRNGASARPPDPVVATEPEPDNLAVATRWAIIGMFVITLIGALYVARSILLPVLAALLIGTTMSPLQKYGEQYGIPRGASAAALVVLFVGTAWLLIWLVAGPVAEWVTTAPDLAQVFKEKLRWLDGPLATLKEFKDSMGEPAGPKVAVETSLASIGQQALLVLTPALSEFLVFFGTLLFYLVGHNRLRRHLIARFGTRDARLRVMRIWGDIEQNLIGYISTVTVINLGVGAATALLMWAVGFPSPLVWGILAFVLNYIPYLGPAIFVIMLFLAGLIVTPTLGTAVLPPALFVLMTTIEGHLLTPSIVGRRFTVSPLLVFLGLAFWTWLWGPFGAFLAVPFLIIGQVVIGHLLPKDEVTLPG